MSVVTLHPGVLHILTNLCLPSQPDKPPAASRVPGRLPLTCAACSSDGCSWQSSHEPHQTLCTPDILPWLQPGFLGMKQPKGKR